MRSIRPVALVALVCVFVGACARPQTFISGDWKFSAKFPCKVESSTQPVATQVGTITIATYGCQTGFPAAGYMVLATDTPPDSTFSYEGAAAGAARNVNGKVRTSAPIQLGDVTGREVVIDITDKNEVGRTRIFLVGHRVYQVMCVTPPNGETGKPCVDFLDSFKLVG
jgi:hypothetical protein